eukprot:scaffold202608_cov39-Tisochrysis_lutea.AAC.3
MHQDNDARNAPTKSRSSHNDEDDTTSDRTRASSCALRDLAMTTRRALDTGATLRKRETVGRNIDEVHGAHSLPYTAARSRLPSRPH